MHDRESIVLFKFGQYRWLKKIQEGELSFATIGSFVEIAKKTGNDEQGDPDEGVFARLKKDDVRIDNMKRLLHNDLEIIDDNKYVKLRRKSSLHIPAFCFYSYNNNDAMESAIEKVGKQVIRHDFDKRIFTSFADTKKIQNVLNENYLYTQLILIPEPFKYSVFVSLLRENLKIRIKYINYTEFQNEEFFIYPTEERTELFYKFPKYSYQKEARICLVDKSLMNIYDRYNLKVDKFIKNHSKIIIGSELYFETSVMIGLID